MEIPLGEHCLRPWRRGDEPALVKYANNPRVAANLRDRFPHPYTPADARDWIERAGRQQQPIANFAIASAREAIGGIGIIPGEDVARRSAEIGYWLGEPFWGRGIATQAVEAMTAYAFSSFDLLRLGAWVFDGNAPSVRVLEKAGYVYEGRLRQAAVKNGKVLDLLLYARVRE
jgi:RimJ/RimL family protein N-acetyltransferase